MLRTGLKDQRKVEILYLQVLLESIADAIGTSCFPKRK